MGFVEKMCIIDVDVKNSMNIIIPRALIFYGYKMNISTIYTMCVFHCFGGHLARLTRMVCLNFRWCANT